MPLAWKERLIKILRWSERYTKTDMVYFASGNFWLTANRVVSVGSGMALTVAFANLIPPEVFGKYKYILALVSIFGAFTLNGIGTAVIRAVAQGNKDIVIPVFWKTFLWSLPASGAAALGSIYYLWNDNRELSLGLALIALSNPLFNSFVIWKSLFIGSKDFKAMAKFSVPRSLIQIGIMIAVLVLRKDIFSILIAYFASNLILSGWMYLTSLRRYSIRAGSLADPQKTRETLSYGKHLSVMGMFAQAFGYIDQFLLWHFVGPVQLAVYSFAQAPVREIRNFSENFFPVIFPKYANKSIEDIKAGMRLRVKQMFFVSALISIAYIVAAPFIFKLLFPKYLSAVLASQIMALAILFQPKGLVETLITAHGDIKKRYATAISTNVVRVALLGALVPLYGFMGAAVAIVASEAIAAMIYYIAYKRL